MKIIFETPALVLQRDIEFGNLVVGRDSDSENYTTTVANKFHSHAGRVNNFIIDLQIIADGVEISNLLMRREILYDYVAEHPRKFPWQILVNCICSYTNVRNLRCDFDLIDNNLCYL